MVRYVIFARHPGGPWRYYSKISQDCEAPWKAAKSTVAVLKNLFPDSEYKVIVVLL